ncbi:MAG: DUF3293 domain-containing protein [Pseudomonas sp.]|nr:DUF3293 domain-containing protein [Pseudomonas sp.]
MHALEVVDAAGLALAYAKADYAVALDGDALALRVGETATDLEAYWPAQRYAFITAWNPASQPRPDEANAQADVMLVALLDEAGAPRLPAWAAADDGTWREPGWLVADLDPGALDRLAVEFGQAGVLAWDRGAPVRLRMLLARPAAATAADPGAHTDWLE